MSEDKKIKEMNEKLVEFTEKMHEQNRRRIKIGLRCIGIIPAVFLFLMFATDSSKIIFLVLWIASLFGIAVYLIVVEYHDYVLQKKLQEIGGKKDPRPEELLDGKRVEDALSHKADRIRIFQVFLTDVRRLSGNVVAVVIVMGLSIIPALYAWFNILSNWDPYGPSATSQMKIAVFSEDEGVDLGKKSLNVGQKVTDGLASNTTIGWVFPETGEEALKCVYSGECYAALIIPKDFTVDMLSFLGGAPENPKISYYENSKKNAIATKITGKAKTAVQQEVNTVFVSTLAEVVSVSGELLTQDGVTGQTALEGMISRLAEVQGSLRTFEGILTSFAAVTGTATELADSAQSLFPGIEGMAEGGVSAINGMQNALITSAQAADTVSDMMRINLDAISSGLDALEKEIDNLKGVGDLVQTDISFDYIGKLTETTLGILGDLIPSDNPDYEVAWESYRKLEKDMDTLQKDTDLTEQKLADIKRNTRQEIADCRVSVEKLRIHFDHEVAPNLDDAVYDMQRSLLSAQMMLMAVDDSFPAVEKALGDYAEILSQGTENIEGTKSDVAVLSERLDALLTGLKALAGDGRYIEIVQLFENNPQLIAAFVSSPVQMQTEKFFEIKTYGSAMAAFYTVLALWVGALILVALIHVGVKPSEELKGLKPWQAYFGRYLTFFCIGQMQNLITVGGNLFFVEIQCPHPFLLWLAGAVLSLVFTLFIYSLTVAFGNVGEAVAVIVMVVQVAGAGGTFPVEVLPEVFRAVYRFLPFTYGMDAMRECIGGLYELDYLKDIGILCIYLGISLVIGLVLAIPCRKMNHIIEEGKAKSGLMI